MLWSFKVIATIATFQNLKKKTKYNYYSTPEHMN